MLYRSPRVIIIKSKIMVNLSDGGFHWAKYRKIYNLSRSGLSSSLRTADIIVSPARILMYETGQRTPPLEKAQTIARLVLADDIIYRPK